MSKSTTKIEWSSDDADVLRSFQKVDDNLDQIARKLNKVERASQKSSRAIETGFGRAIKTAKGFALELGGVGSAAAGVAAAAAAALRLEWQELKQQQTSAAEANLNLAEVMPGVYRAAGGMLSAEQIQTQVRRISGETSVSQVKVARAIEEALAARGAKNEQQAMGAIAAAGAALTFAPGASPETIAALAGGTTDLQRRFGIGPKAAIGYLARVGGQARVTSLQKQVQNLNPAIGGLAAYGASPQVAGGLVSALTGASGDFTGASSATAALQLASQLEEIGFDKVGVGIQALQRNAGLRRKFLEGGKIGGEKYAGASFEAKMEPFIQQLLTGGSNLAQAYEGAVREVGTFQQGKATFGQMVREINKFQSVRLADMRRAFQQGSERLLVGRFRGAKSAVNRKQLGQLLAAAGAGYIDQATTQAVMEALGGPNAGVIEAGEVIDELRERAAERTSTESFVVSGGTGGRGTVITPEVTARDHVVADVFRDVADKLDRLIENTDPQSDDQPRVRNPPAAAQGVGIRR